MLSDFSAEMPFTTLTQRLATDEVTDGNLSIYPNPNKGTFQLRFTTDGVQGVSASVYDLRGKEIYRRSEDLPTGTYEWDFSLSGVSAGIYHLRLNIGMEVRTIKVVVE
jgi:hypothetical protein